MKSKLIIAMIALVFAAQWYVPASMISINDDILETGVLYKFRTAPIDPVDPLRGKYVQLNFDIESYDTGDSTYWKDMRTVYVSLTVDSAGFGVVEDVTLTEPESGDYIKAKGRNYNGRIWITYPFNRFYMEESKAYPAEQLYRQARSEQEAYAEVYVKEGETVLSEVYVNDMPIKEAVELYMDTLTVQ